MSKQRAATATREIRTYRYDEAPGFVIWEPGPGTFVVMQQLLINGKTCFVIPPDAKVHHSLPGAELYLRRLLSALQKAEQPKLALPWQPRTISPA